MKPIRQELVPHRPRILREQALQPPVAPIHQHQRILGHTCWHIRVVMSMHSDRFAGSRRSLHAIGTLIESVRDRRWEWMLLLLSGAVVGLVCRVGVDGSGPPPPALAISGRTLLVLMMMMLDAMVGLSYGARIILGRCGQRAVRLERLLQLRGIVVAAPRLGRVGPAVEFLSLLGDSDLGVRVKRQSCGGTTRRWKGPTYPLATERASLSEIM
jgi:hypothetical protein